MAYTIVRFEAERHTAILSDIWFRASLIAHPFIGEATLSEQKPLMEDVYLPLATTFVACRDGVPVGFISMLKNHIAALFVDPDMQGQGIGRRLLDHVTEGRDELSLEVYLANERAMGFYAVRGFEVASVRDVDDQSQPYANARMVWRRA